MYIYIYIYIYINIDVCIYIYILCIYCVCIYVYIYILCISYVCIYICSILCISYVCMYIFEGSLQQQRGSRPWLTWQACSGLLEENGLGPNELFEKTGVGNSENHLNILNYSKAHFIYFCSSSWSMPDVIHHISLHCRCSDRPLRWFLNHGSPHPEVIARCWRCCDATHWWMSCRTVGTLSSMDWDETRFRTS